MSDVITVVPSAKLAFAGYLRGFGGGLGGSEPGALISISGGGWAPCSTLLGKGETVSLGGGGGGESFNAVAGTLSSRYRQPR